MRAVCTLIIWSLCAAIAPLWAQTTSVSGEVTDPTGAVVPGTIVRLKSSANEQTLTTATNGAGRYFLSNVAPGAYGITFNKPGFSTLTIDIQRVDVGLGLTLNAVLQLGSVSTVVEVGAPAGETLQSMNSTVSSVVSGKLLNLLPNIGRDAATFGILQPGVSPEGANAGASYDQNTFRLDGGNNSNDVDGSSNIYTPSFASSLSPAGGVFGHNQGQSAPAGTVPTPVESIDEIKVASSGMTADFNSSSGSEIQMVTKRGTDQFHGSVYEYYFASNVGAANSWDNNHTPKGNLAYTPLPKTHNNRFGISIGGPLLRKTLGGRAYFFLNYEGFRFPQSQVWDATGPTALMRAGVIQIDEGGTYVPYNLNPSPVTVDGVTYPGGTCPGACDPRGIGLNPAVSEIWQKFMPLPNNFSGPGDHHNTAGYLSTIKTPVTSNNFVARLDHDFGEKWHWFASYRGFHATVTTASQVDIGGAIRGDKFGEPTALSHRPQLASYWVTGLTANINPSTTNTFNFSFLRNFWQWGDAGAAPQLPSIGSALEIGGESSNALVPYNVDTADTRQRFWDGHDTTLRDDVAKIVDNHLIQFGGIFQHNYDYHQRNDNGGGIQNMPIDNISTSSGGVTYPSQYQPAQLPTSQIGNYNLLFTEVLGITGESQDLYTRSGPNLMLNPPGSVMFDQSSIRYYNLYASDTWRTARTFTLNYGLGYAIEMPPVEKNGKQVELTDVSGVPIVASDYLRSRESAAVQGQVYNPTLAFTTIKNVVNASTKYPYKPDYTELSPRLSAAWSPRFEAGFLGRIFGNGLTVVRGGYGRIYGRLNGTAQVITPLLGTGLGQALACIGATSTGECLGQSGANPINAFRIGVDGSTAPLPSVSQTLPQPYIPGFNGNAPAGPGAVIDPDFKPARTDNFNMSIQRVISSKLIVEAGYIGRIIRNDFQGIDLDAVPAMTTLNGQSFAAAFAQVYIQLCGLGPSCSGDGAVSAQPFFEAAMGGAGSAACSGYSSCTSAMVHNSTTRNQIATTSVYDLWASLNQEPSWPLGRTMPSSPINGGSGQSSAIFMNTSSGYGNYNAGYVSFTAHDWYGLTANTNFTYGKALGTNTRPQAQTSYTALNPWNLHSMYGSQAYDYRFIFNTMMLYEPRFNLAQRGLLGHLASGWGIAPLFTAYTGGPLQVYNYNNSCQSFGEGNCSAEVSLNGAVLASKYTGGNSPHYNLNIPQGNAANPYGVGINTNSGNGGGGVNMFSNPIQVYNEFRPCILGYDESCGSTGQIRAPGFWNLDTTVSKDIGLWREGKVGATLIVQFTNVLNHTAMNAPSVSLGDPADFGNMSSNNAYFGAGEAFHPRQVEFGVRVHY